MVVVVSCLNWCGAGAVKDEETVVKKKGSSSTGVFAGSLVVVVKEKMEMERGRGRRWLHVRVKIGEEEKIGAVTAGSGEEIKVFVVAENGGFCRRLGRGGPARNMREVWWRRSKGKEKREGGCCWDLEGVSAAGSGAFRRRRRKVKMERGREGGERR
ncbi:hypothetical protein HAX54_018838 [Datura stramonium]|uniref:Uncharacterized protein n=1 Tax=Datura stramonium TaxID=4076 RepID=A0ABS8UQ64_DATST|nr:hypothetical protein [Datura stramonium]